jgi:hypothetical protein
MNERIGVDGEDGDDASETPTRIVVDGDSITFPVEVGLLDRATVTVKGGIKLSGTGDATIEGKQVCLVEEVKKKPYEYTYSKGAKFEKDGDGTLRIEAAAADHIHSTDKVMVSNGKVKLFFTPGAPATNPHPPKPLTDTSPPSGSHEFTLEMSNKFVNSIKK